MESNFQRCLNVYTSTLDDSSKTRAQKKKDGEVKLYTFPDKLSFKWINKIARKMRRETNYALALHVGER